MVDTVVNYVSFFEIQGDDDYWAVYANRVDVIVKDRDPVDYIAEVAKTGKLPAGGQKPGVGDDPYRYLDIVEERPGPCTYVFFLNATDKKAQQRLQFLPESPFIPLPLNSNDGEAFLTEFHNYGSAGQWASFRYDPEKAKGSGLADRIRKAGEDEHEEQQARHSPKDMHPEISFLAVPFSFNLIDPVLGAAPWTVLPDSHDFETGQFRSLSRKTKLKILTHGGVHPSDIALVVAEL